MPPMKNLTGERYGRLVVIREEGRRRGRITWICKCDCGNETIKVSGDLKSGRSRSCGCIREEKPNHLIHGDSHTRLHGIWLLMLDRCENPRNHCYFRYGGRGISICDEWHDYRNFKKWALENGYREDLSIDRINNNGNYEPGNCRWADDITQANNKSSNRKVFQYSKDGEFIKSYNSIAFASRAVGTSITNIIHACKGEQNTAGGFRWKYAEKEETA